MKECKNNHTKILYQTERCPLCDIKIDFKHYINECDKFNEQMNNLIQSMKQEVK